MNAAVRSFHSPDVDLETFVPEDPTDVDVLIQIVAGPADDPGDESFNVLVTTPTSLRRRVDAEGPIIGRHYLIVPKWDWQGIKAYLTDQVTATEGPTWPVIGEKLGRIGMWEFEDYKPNL